MAKRKRRKEYVVPTFRTQKEILRASINAKESNMAKGRKRGSKQVPEATFLVACVNAIKSGAGPNTVVANLAKSGHSIQAQSVISRYNKLLERYRMEAAGYEEKYDDGTSKIFAPDEGKAELLKHLPEPNKHFVLTKKASTEDLLAALVASHNESLGNVGAPTAEELANNEWDYSEEDE